MINYADYEFYIETYEGKLSQDLFDSIIPKASRSIDKAVNKKIEESDITDKVKFVTCELVDYLYSKNKRNNVSTIIIDGVHKTFKDKTSNEERRELREILSGLPLELTRYL